MQPYIPFNLFKTRQQYVNSRVYIHKEIYIFEWYHPTSRSHIYLKWFGKEKHDMLRLTIQYLVFDLPYYHVSNSALFLISSIVPFPLDVVLTLSSHHASEYNAWWWHVDRNSQIKCSKVIVLVLGELGMPQYKHNHHWLQQNMDKKLHTNIPSQQRWCN